MPLELNKEQLAAADFLNGICVVVAVPGSGKTLTMTHRIGNLVK
ncbi:MAG: UvrD-helicase domain-containing protein, partial [bacterium]|nr:UvrD-helicase domain-containing protein [bacterium]